MIKTVKIENFKSIKHLSFDCRKLNLFIGKPNSGKSNILESIGVFGLWDTYDLKELIRFSNFSDLFFELDTQQKIELTIDNLYLEFKFPNEGRFLPKELQPQFFVNPDGTRSHISPSKDPKMESIRLYKFDQLPPFVGTPIDKLTFPDGENLPAVLYSNRELRNLLGNLMEEFQLEILISAGKNTIDVQKKADGISIAYSLASVSETLRRLIFYLAAIKTNQNSTLIFEEPEAHAFPYYTKYLSELIAQDQSNQYFISTHNPYFLLSMIEKTPREELAVYVVSMKSGQTHVKLLKENELQEILDEDMDVFFNIEKLAE
ncbi:MAG: AAA family ATPase [Ignavibacteriales bacterium]|nr:AAA family ATPase [Ignavibacteriales bacterium]